ncbi:MAG TPA: hypothetical protein VF608_01315, partial [Thermoanaerobaculia bacterium]
MNTARRHDAIVLTILVLVPIALFADVLFGNRVLYFGDVSAYHYPLKKVLRDVISRGDFPSWNPYIAGGQPMAANPAHAVFYPPTWLILLPGFNVSFHLLIVLHFLIATFGMYALLRSMELRRFTSALAGLAFGCGGLLVSASVTFPFLFSASWIPWVCLFTRRFLRTGDRRAFALASAALAMQLLIGEPTTALQTGIILLIYARRQFVRVAMIGIVALLLASVQVIPLVDHFRDTNRARGVDFKLVSSRSTPPLRIAELVVPYPFGAYAAHERNRINDLYPGGAPFFRSIYPGMLLGALCLAALFARTRGRWLLLITLGLSMFLAAGSHTPLLRGLFDLGIASVVCYPEKFLIMGIFAAIVFAAAAFERLLDGDEAIRKRMLIVLVIVAASTFLLRAPAWPNLARALALLLVVAALPRLRKPVALAILAAFTFIDLATVIFPLQPRLDASFYDEPPALKALPPDRDSYRVFALAEWSLDSPRAKAFNVDHPEWIWIRRGELLPLSPLTYGIRLALDNDYDLTGLARSSDFNMVASKLADERNRNWINAFAAMSNVRAISVYRNPQQAFAEARGVVRDVQPVRFVAGNGWPRFYFSSKLIPIRTKDDFLAHLRKEKFPPDVAFVEGNAFAPAKGRVLNVRETSNAA